LSYHLLTRSKTKPERAELDLLLAGTDDPQSVAEANAAAMQALGQIGGLPPRKRRKEKGVE